MTATKSKPIAVAPDGEPLEPIDQNPHYVRSVTEVGERTEVVADQDIYASNGMKLLAKGARIDRSKWEKLTDHKLKMPLDLLLVAADTVNAVALAIDAQKAIAADPVLSMIAMRSGDPGSFNFALGGMVLPHPIAFRLTVMREDRADLYQHSLRTAIIAHYIGVRLALPQQKKEDLVLAALCHDLGEMHTDPAMLAPGRRIEESERRFVYVHPVTGYVVLQQLKAIPPEVMQAVLQHHERLDGSGYPHGESGDKIGLLARIIAVAETLEVVARRFDVKRLDVILRLNLQRLDSRVTDALRELLQADLHAAGGNPEESLVASHVARFTTIFRGWLALKQKIESEPVNAPLRFLVQRIASLNSLAFQAGLDTELLSFLDLAGDDAAIVNELNASAEEMDRLLEDLAFEIDRRILSDEACRATAVEVVALLRTGGCRQFSPAVIPKRSEESPPVIDITNG